MLGPLESQGTHSIVSGCLKCKIFTPACCKELQPLGLKLGFLLNTDMCAHCARNQEGIKTLRWPKPSTSPDFRVLSWLLPQGKRVSGLILLLSKIAVLKWATALGALSPCRGCRHPAWDEVPRAAGRWQSEVVLGKGFSGLQLCLSSRLLRATVRI